MRAGTASSMIAIRKPGSLTCWQGFQITPPTKLSTCFPGIGRRTNSPRSLLQPERFAQTIAPAWGAGRMRTIVRRTELFRVESERLELPSPFGRRIAQPLDANTTGQAAFDCGFDKIGSEEGERDRHVDLPNAARAGRRRPGFPVRGDHRFRWMTTTCSGRWRPGQQGCGRA